MAAKQPGIVERHARECSKQAEDSKCICTPSIEAWAWSKADQKKIYRRFSGKGAMSAAKGWRADAVSGTRKGTMRAPAPTTLNQAWDVWLEGAKAGTIRNRAGEIFKPSVIRSYETSMKLRVLDKLGAHRLCDIRRVDVQDFADGMLGDGLDPSTIRNTLNPLRAVCRRALSRNEISVNPTTAVELPAVTGRRERIATPAEAAELIDALAETDRCLWSAAFYAGLRRGELRGLKWDDVDLAAGVVRVRRSWDDSEGEIETKSRAGRRDVPIVAALRSYLLEHRLRSGRSEGFVFGRSKTAPFTPSHVRRQAAAQWVNVNKERKEKEIAALEPIGLHEARHTFASLLIAAGVNVKAISTYMGHSSVTITLDRYGHLMPGHEIEAVQRIDAYLAESAL